MFMWSCGFLPNDTLARIRDNLGNEGETTKLYLDTRSFVTIGIGTMLPDAGSARTVNFTRDATGAPATEQEKMTAWKKIQDLSPQKAELNFNAAHYVSMTDISIDHKEAQRLRDVKLDAFYHDLVDICPGFDSMPEAAKIALFDMIYNIGPSLRQKFPSFNKAIRIRDWAQAAAHCDRKGIRSERNQKTRLQLLSCVSNQQIVAKPVTTAADRPVARPSGLLVPVVHETMKPYHERLPHPFASCRGCRDQAR